MTKAIIFDLWGTLVENGVHSPIKQVKNILSRLPKENLHIGKIYFHKILIRKMLDFIFYFIPKKILKKILKIYL